jgi:hypothetical protein
MADLLFLARLARSDVLVLTRLCARNAFSLEELRELARLLRLRQDAATAQRAVDASMRRLEKNL